jgi:hypothetical protein
MKYIKLFDSVVDYNLSPLQEGDYAIVEVQDIDRFGHKRNWGLKTGSIFLIITKSIVKNEHDIVIRIIVGQSNYKTEKELYYDIKNDELFDNEGIIYKIIFKDKELEKVGEEFQLLKDVNKYNL